MSIGENIKTLRKQKGLTQEELAHELHVTVSAVSQWESNKTVPDTMMIAPICKELNVSADELLEIATARGQNAFAADKEIERLLEKKDLDGAIACVLAYMQNEDVDMALKGGRYAVFMMTSLKEEGDPERSAILLKKVKETAGALERRLAVAQLQRERSAAKRDIERLNEWRSLDKEIEKLYEATEYLKKAKALCATEEDPQEEKK